MNQKQLEKLARAGYISLVRNGKRIESITVKKTRGLATYHADPAGPGPEPLAKTHTKKVKTGG